MDFENMTTYELSDHVRDALSHLYRKLREDEGFGYEQHWSIVSYGECEYDWKLIVIDENSHNTGDDWPRTWWI